MRAVYITGIGLISPLGCSMGEFKDSILRAKSGIVLSENGEGRVRAMASVSDEISEHFSPQEHRLFDRTTQFCLKASDAALADAGLLSEAYPRERAGVFIGCGGGATVSLDQTYRELVGANAISGLSLLRCLPNAPASHVSIKHKLTGPCQTYAVACASGSIAIGEAFRAIRDGYIDVALAGGVECPLSEGSIRSWEAMRVLARPNLEKPEASCRPFSSSRAGLVLGEGAAMYVLECAENVRARNGRAHAGLQGYGASADAEHIVMPSLAGQVSAMSSALADSGLSISDIGYINAHGTATKVGDVVETKSIRAVFKNFADSLQVSSTKSMHGHLLGASGAVELASAVLAVRDGVISPTAFLDSKDPECDLDYVPNVARISPTVTFALSNSFAFGGSNACLIVSKP